MENLSLHLIKCSHLQNGINFAIALTGLVIADVSFRLPCFCLRNLSKTFLTNLQSPIQSAMQWNWCRFANEIAQFCGGSSFPCHPRRGSRLWNAKETWTPFFSFNFISQNLVSLFLSFLWRWRYWNPYSHDYSKSSPSQRKSFENTKPNSFYLGAGLKHLVLFFEFLPPTLTSLQVWVTPLLQEKPIFEQTIHYVERTFVHFQMHSHSFSSFNQASRYATIVNRSVFHT